MKDFEQMTTNELKQYRGPVYRAQIDAWPPVEDPKAERVCRSMGLNSASPQGLQQKIQKLTADGWEIRQIVEGPHYVDEARRAIVHPSTVHWNGTRQVRTPGDIREIIPAQHHDFRISYDGGSVATESGDSADDALVKFFKRCDRRKPYTLKVERQYAGQWQMIDAGTFRYVSGKWTRDRVG